MPIEHTEITSKKIWRPFVVNVTLVVLLVILGIFIGLFLNNKRLIEGELEIRARSNFKNILIMRRWNALHGGVFVEKRPGVVSNPYLLNPDIQAVDGKTYTKKNPALMTREISELAEADGEYQFHITSLKPLNPSNTPDSFEKKALTAFEKGEKEVFFKERLGEKVFFRYMAPLYVESGCLPCHAQQGYKVGDVRGGISVKFDIAAIEKTLKIHRLILLSLFFVTLFLLLGIIYLQILNLVRQLEEAQKKISLMAITDELTGLFNRRYFLSKLELEETRARRYRRPLSCLMLDLDYFKKINDSYGHQAGDQVLRRTGKILLQCCRHSDIPARYGGEEFVILLPESDREGAMQVAEKIRALIDSEAFQIGQERSLQVTCSLGVSSCAPEELQRSTCISQLIEKADSALYMAKKNGRNRVEYSI